MGLFNNFTAKVQAGGKGGKGEDYALDELLVALDMAANDVPKKKIAALLDRTIDSLNYKVFEGQTTIKGKTQVRSIKRYWFVDHTKKDSGFVDEEIALKKLFEAHGEKYTTPENVTERIAAYCQANGIELGDDEGESAPEAPSEDASTEETSEDVAS